MAEQEPLRPIEIVTQEKRAWYPVLYRSNHGAVPVDSKTDLRGMTFADLCTYVRTLSSPQRSELVRVLVEAEGEARAEEDVTACIQ